MLKEDPVSRYNGFVETSRCTDFARDVLSVAISVLSIVFSIFAAAVAIITSSTDDDFVIFLEETGDYTGLLSTFRVALAALFAALLCGVVLYGLDAYWLASSGSVRHVQPKWYFVSFATLVAYGLVATFLTMTDLFSYSRRRVEHLRKRRQRRP